MHFLVFWFLSLKNASMNFVDNTSDEQFTTVGRVWDLKCFRMWNIMIALVCKAVVPSHKIARQLEDGNIIGTCMILEEDAAALKSLLHQGCQTLGPWARCITH